MMNDFRNYSVALNYCMASIEWVVGFCHDVILLCCLCTLTNLDLSVGLQRETTGGLVGTSASAEAPHCCSEWLRFGRRL